MNPPSFYQENYEKYRRKVEKDLKETKENPLLSKENISNIEHLIRKRLNSAANSSQFGFESTLRNFKPFETVYGPDVKWREMNINPKITLTQFHLPPKTKNGIKNLANIDKYVTRPCEVFREVIFTYIILFIF
jgi:hypothetical protein